MSKEPMIPISVSEKAVKVNFCGYETVCARYEDQQGIYFLNGMLDKQYVPEEIVNPSKVSPTKIETVDENKTYRFWVEYWHGDTVRRKFTKRTGKTVEEAMDKVYTSFKHVINLESY